MQLDVVLQVPQWVLETRRCVAGAQAHDEIQGRVDSSALGLVVRDTESSLPFGPFGARLLAAAVRERGPDSNTVASPVSAGMALSLALLGARGMTAAALSGALGTSALDRAELERRGAAFIASVADRRDVQLEIAHAVWVDSVARLVPSFEASAAAWHATVGTLSLSSEAAVETINAWADSVTHGRIPTILDEPGSDTARLFIASSVYFEGKWLEPFDRGETGPRDFTLRSGRTVPVPMMARTGRMAYTREAGYQMVRLPYRGGRVAMYVILPDSGDPDGSGALVRRFAESGWPPSLDEAQMRDVELVLPKLHVEMELDLAPVLRALGAGIALGGDSADFRDLAVDRATGRELPLFVEEALQRVYLDVDEEGTEAAAVTGLTMAEITSVPPPRVLFVVARPFLFALRDEVSGADLFVGSIQSP